MFSKSAAFYDAIYAFKDYAWECEKLLQVIGERNTGARSLLDVACGTGMHLSGLKKHLRCEGIDLDDNLIAISKTRNPELVHHIGDMRQFDLAKRFDVVTCLFGSIGYLPDIDALNSGIQSMTQHLAKGGLLIVEPWLTPDVFKAGHLGSLFIDNDDLKIARINISRVEGRQSILDFHYLVGTPTGVDGLYEEHRMTLFTNEEYLAAFQNAGLSVERDADGLMGRGLFVGQA